MSCCLKDQTLWLSCGFIDSLQSFNSETKDIRCAVLDIRHLQIFARESQQAVRYPTYRKPWDVTADSNGIARIIWEVHHTWYLYWHCHTYVQCHNTACTAGWILTLRLDSTLLPTPLSRCQAFAKKRCRAILHRLYLHFQASNRTRLSTANPVPADAQTSKHSCIYLAITLEMHLSLSLQTSIFLNYLQERSAHVWSPCLCSRAYHGPHVSANLARVLLAG